MLQEHNAVALRRVRLLRLVDEALDQGGEPTQEDLGKALGVTDRTIRSDIAALEAEGYRVATRGKLRGVGRGQTHKVIIVELYLKRYTYTEIRQRTRHSVYAIKRYIIIALYDAIVPPLAPKVTSGCRLDTNHGCRKVVSITGSDK